MTTVADSRSTRRDRRPRTRIQTANRQIILDAALQVFAASGFRGATVDRIAAQAGMSKPNLLYYFRSKDEIYRQVLESTLATWLAPLERLDPAGDPIAEIAGYIRHKLEMSRQMPEASRLFANEVLHGAPAIGEFLRGPLRDLVARKAAVIRGWIDEGRLAPVDPVHLIFMIWATTQHYADFDVQVRAVLGEQGDTVAAAEETVLAVFLNGLRPRR
ncbi:TetR family transcriptional regulator C-terminal domain-containing protein [Tepidamorphus gemmatus]